MPNAKEPHYFGRDLDFRDSRRISRDDYLRLFAAAKTEKSVGEASVFYLLSETAAQEIHQFNPESRIIAIFRNPVDMLYSFHSQRYFNGTEDIKDFKAALAAEEDRKVGRLLPRNLGLVQGLYYRDVIKYAQQIERFIKVFGRENVHIIIFEEFRGDTRNAYLDLCRFLEIYEGTIPDFKVVNPNKAPRSHLLSKILWSPPRILQRAARLFIPSSSRRRLAMSIRRMNTLYRERQPLDPSLRESLQCEFKPDVEHLEQLLGRDLSIWFNA